MSYVYFIGCLTSDNEARVKIGFTRRNPAARRKDFQPGSAHRLDVIAFIEGDIPLERLLHRMFAAQRIHNEWFVCEGPLEALICYLIEHGSGSGAVTPSVTFAAAMAEAVKMPEPA